MFAFSTAILPFVEMTYQFAGIFVKEFQISEEVPLDIPYSVSQSGEVQLSLSPLSLIRRGVGGEVLRCTSIDREALYTVKKVNSPFIGSAISIPQYVSKNPSIGEVNNIAKKIGIKQEHEWMFIIYKCWAGEIDDLFGYIKKPKRQIASIIESDKNKLENAYISFMEKFGVSKDEALDFEPFKRGFWEEQ